MPSEINEIEGWETYFKGQPFRYSNPHEFLAGCLQIIYHIANRIQKLSDHPEPTRDRRKTIERSLVDAQVILGQGNILNCFVTWGERALVGIDENDLFYQLYISLIILDQHFLKRPPIKWETPFGILFLGHFWNLWAIEDKMVENDFRPFSDRKFFRALALVKPAIKTVWQKGFDFEKYFKGALIAENLGPNAPGTSLCPSIAGPH